MSFFSRLLLLFLGLLSFCQLSMASSYFASEHFISIADLHFNPYAVCRQKIPCPLLEELRVAPARQWDSLFAKYQETPSTYHQDTNYALLASTLTELQQVRIERHARFVIVLGDFLSHHFREDYIYYTHDQTDTGYQQFVKTTLEFLTLKLQSTFPMLNVYMALGNNDTYQDDYSSDPKGPFFTQISEIWSTLLKDPKDRRLMQDSFATAGYYALNAPAQPKLRIIVLNSNLFSYKAHGTGVSYAAEQQLVWLEKELSAVAAHHQHALIMMHIPIGIDIYSSYRNVPFSLVEFYAPEHYGQRLSALWKQYADNIMGIFPGHLHMDGWQILEGGHHPIPMPATPGISPLFGNNPGFKLYTYGATSLQLIDATTYFYPLTDKQQWGAEYSFNAVYQPECKDCQLIQGMLLVSPTGELANKYKMYFSVGTDSQKIDARWRYYWCEMHAVLADTFNDCLKTSTLS